MKYLKLMLWFLIEKQKSFPEKKLIITFGAFSYYF